MSDPTIHIQASDLMCLVGRDIGCPTTAAGFAEGMLNRLNLELLRYESDPPSERSTTVAELAIMAGVAAQVVHAWPTDEEDQADWDAMLAKARAEHAKSTEAQP